MTNGLGVPIQDIPHKNALLLNMGSWLIAFFWYLCTAMAKIAILCFLRRVIGISRITRTIVDSTIGAVCVWLVGGVLLTTLNCHPLPFYWDKTIEGGKCLENSKYTAASIVFAVGSMVLDLWILAIPLKTVWSIKMTTAKKIAVSAILGIGVV